MEKINVIKNFRNGIFVASSRTYGEKIMEPIIRKIFGLHESNTDENDAVNDNGEFIELKASKVLRTTIKKKNLSLIERVLLENDNDELSRLVNSKDYLNIKYLSNIQNVKRDHFSELIYVLLFEDCIKIFKSNKENISNIPNWSDKHGRYDAEGKSGQFGITKNNIQWHLDNNLIQTLSWEEVYEISKDIL
jgi:hypothetical protein